MLKMIKYNLKKRSLLLLITTIVSLAIGFALLVGEDFVREYWVYNDQSYKEGSRVIGPSDAPLMYITIIACILCTIIPIVEFSFKMSKVNIDQMYSLPIKREKLYIAKYISGFIEVLIPVLAVFIFCLLKILSTDHMYNMIHILPYFGCLLFFMIILYSTITFFYTRGNTIVDGIMNIVFIVFVYTFISLALWNVFPRPIRNYFESNGSFLYSPIIIVTNIFTNRLSVDALSSIMKDAYSYGYGDRITFETTEIISMILFSVIGIISTILFVKLNKEDKAENSMQISNSWFSYRTMIPIYFSTICLILCDEGELVSFIFLFVGTYVAYIIFRRSLKIKKWDIITTAICLVSVIILYIIIDNLEPVQEICNEYCQNMLKLILK